MFGFIGLICRPKKLEEPTAYKKHYSKIVNLILPRSDFQVQNDLKMRSTISHCPCFNICMDVCIFGSQCYVAHFFFAFLEVFDRIMTKSRVTDVSPAVVTRKYSEAASQSCFIKLNHAYSVTIA